MTISAAQRFTRQRPCPVCGGFDQSPRGKGERCYGFISDDGEWAHCTRAEYAGGIESKPETDAYAHRLKGECRCGKSHGIEPIAPKPSTNGHGPLGKLVKTYNYVDESGTLLFQVVRYSDPKDFRQRRPDGKGGWIWNLEGTRRVLYRLPELLASTKERVFIVEGEKDVDALWDLGLVATCNPMGAGKWSNEYNGCLQGRHVVVIPDMDPPNPAKPAEHMKGQRHGQAVANSLYGTAASVRYLELSGLPDHGDVSDWFDQGHTVDELLDLARKCPEWTPKDEEAPLEEAAHVQLHVTSLNQVVPEQVKPLWPKRIFRGKLAVLAGDPGMGKSYASLDIAARVSLGGPWPDGSGHAPQGNVLLVSAEDGLADTVKPRLELLGADMSRIDSLGLTVSKGEEEVGLSLQHHLPQIEQLILEKGIILLVVDPLLAFTGRTDTHKAAEVRALLSPMAAMAERTGCAILAVMHPNKNSQEGNALYRISSSLDFAAAARSVMVVAKHPDDPEQRVLATVKCNLSAHPEPLAYGFTTYGCFTWKGVTEVDISQLMAPPIREEDRNEREVAKEFLKTLLANGPVPANQVEEERKELGIARRTLERAKAALEIESTRSGTEEKGRGKGKWEWCLPEHLPQSFKDATPPTPTSGNLKNLRAEGDSITTEKREIFKDANPEAKDLAILNGEDIEVEL